MTQDWLLRHANAIEGHPDNVAAAIYGGFVLAYQGRAGVLVAQGHVDASIGAALFIPQTSVATKAARGLLPETVPHVDAAANSGRAALLVHALALTRICFTTPPATGCTRDIAKPRCPAPTS